MSSLAKSLGISQSTVSRALSNSREISRETRARIIGAARKSGVSIPQRASVSVLLPVSSMGIIGSNSYMVTELMNEAERRGKLIDFIPLDHIDILNERATEGVISLDFLYNLSKVFGHKWNLPLVCINEHSNLLEQAYSVSSNEQKSMRDTVDYLVGLGHQRIGLLYMGDSKVFISKLRIDIFRQQLTKHGGVPFVEPMNYMGANGIYLPGADLPLNKLLKNKITALICCGEGCWKHTVPALRRAEIRYPKDISLFAWMNPDEEEISDPPFSGVSQNFRELAREAFNMLEKQIRGEQQIQDILVDYLFIEGKSAALPRRKK